MNIKVQEFLAENKEILHNQLLDSLGLYEYEKEYMPDSYDKWQAKRLGYTETETIDGTIRYYKKGDKIYPQISDEEYERLLSIAKEKEHIEEKREAQWKKNNPENKEPTQYNIVAEQATDENFASKFLRFLAWFYWIGGAIASFFCARVEVLDGYRTETVFQWRIFLISVFVCFFAGGFCYCMAELFADIRIIASAIRRFRMKEDI